MLKKLRIGAKLTGGFLLVALLGVAVGLVGWVSLGRVDGTSREISENQVPSLVALGELNGGLAQVRRLDLAMMLYLEAGDVENYRVRRAQFDTAMADVDAGAALFQKLRRDPQAEAEWQRATEALAKLKNHYGQYLPVLESGDVAKGRELSLGPGYGIFNAAAEPVHALIETQQKLAAANQARVAAAGLAGRVAVGIGSLLALLLGLLFGSSLTRSVVRRLDLVVARAEELRERVLARIGEASDALHNARFDLRVQVEAEPIPVESEDELARLAIALNGMLEQSKQTATSFNAAVAAIGHVADDRLRLLGGIERGDLSVRGDPASHGAFGPQIEQMNRMAEALEQPLSEALSVLERLAARDLTARMEGHYQGAYAGIKHAMNATAEQLEAALSDVRSAAEQVAAASDQIGSGSHALAEGASEQASSLEEVSSSLQELSSMSRQNAANAREARGISDDARERAGAGRDRMAELERSVGAIRDSSVATARIVKTIDEIAFQTNLLALNAAVEAARAGDAGKGFAVVAEEVRALAQRSAEAARNTADLIEQAVQAAEGGASASTGVLADLDEILARVARVGEVMGEIAAASEQQSQGVTEIDQAVDQMNAVTQAVASNSEESASAAEQLRAQAARVRELVESFRLGNLRGSAAAGGAPVAVGPAGHGHRNGSGNGKRRAVLPA